MARNRKIKILFAAFEADPFMKTGGLADVAGTLPSYIKDKEFDIRVILPKLDVIPEQYQKKMKFICNYEVPLSWRRKYCGLFQMKHNGVQYYFLDNEYYFKRGKVYGEFDDGERIAFFSKALLESIVHLPNFMPDILHCNDWHTALSPVFLREMYMRIPGYNDIRTIFTVHNLKFQGKYSDFMIGDVLGLIGTPAENQIRQPGAVNFLRGGVHYADRLTTVSPTYANEICTSEYGEGIEDLFNERRNVLSGILNGIDYVKYNPLTEKTIRIPFDENTLVNKRMNKMDLQKDLGLPVDPDTIMFTAISRLTPQKGFDLIRDILPQVVERRMQVVILGIGEKWFEDAFRYYSEKYPDKIKTIFAFDNQMANRLYACADAFLMPSKFEPCGLSQMMAMRYGTLPVVRETGGLKDTVEPYNYATGAGCGFTFSRFSADDLLASVDYALNVWYNDQDAWQNMMVHAMKKDYSWTASAQEYRELYRSLV